MYLEWKYTIIANRKICLIFNDFFKKLPKFRLACIMCCRTNSFCCAHNMQKGIIIAGVIDILLLIALTVFNIVLQNNYFSLWFVVVVIADVLLIIGSMKSVSGLLMAWMVVGMINIVLLFIGWIGMAVYGIMTVFVSTVCNTDFTQIQQSFNDQNLNFDISSINNQ